MKELWKKSSIWDKIGVYVLGAMLIVMIIGLILIGTVSMSTSIKNPITNTSASESHNGFWLLNNVGGTGDLKWTIGNFIVGSKTVGTETIKLSKILVSGTNTVIGGTTVTLTGTAAQLQTGVIFAVILTPILLVSGLGIFGYSFYLKKSKKG